MQVNIEIVVTIGIAIFSAFCVLVKMIRSSDVKRIEDLERTCQKLREAAAKLPVLNETIEARKSEIEGLQHQIDLLFRRQDENAANFKEVNESMADVRETIAGFGCTYVPRKEYADDNRKKED